MTWDEATSNFEFNLVGFISVIVTLTLAFLNGTLLSAFPGLNLPEMNIHDAVAIILSVLSGIFIIVKIANGVLSFISKRRDMKEEKELKDKMRAKMNKPKDEEEG